MKRLTDSEPLKWITNNKDELKSIEDPDWNGNFVSHCIPAQFQSYVKIFHPIYIDIGVNDHEISWNERERKKQKTAKRESNNPTEIVLQKILAGSTLVYGTVEQPVQVQRIRWRDLACRYGLQFHSEINVNSFTRNFPDRSWPRYLIGPEEGTLEEFYCERLVTLLTPFTKSPDCYFAYELIATQTHDTDLLYQGELEEVKNTFNYDNVWGTPTYWWPEDKSWCLYTDWDLTFTLLGGCDELIETLLKDEVIECIRVEARSRIDYKSDQINP